MILWSLSPSLFYIPLELHFQRVSDLHKTEIHLCISPGIDRVVPTNIILVVQVVVPFHPLYEFQVVLVPALAQLFDVNVFLYFAFGEGLLQDLVVVDELPFIPSVPVYSLHGYLPWEHSIYYVAVDCARAQLLDLGDLEVEGGVHPVEEVGLGHEEGTLHHAYALLFGTHRQVNIIGREGIQIEGRGVQKERKQLMTGQIKDDGILLFLMYAKSLVEVGKLIYLVGGKNEYSQLKKILQAGDNKTKLLFKCFEQIPALTFRKIKPENARQGTIRADWIDKIIDRYPEMIIFLFTLGDDTSDTESILREILKRINLLYADFLRPNGKEDVMVRVVVSNTRAQFANQELQGRINYYLKTYEKDVFSIQADNLARDLSKYRNTWLSYLEKNYDRKYRKLAKKLEESNTIEKRICYSFKLALFSEILGKDEKAQYANCYNIIKYKFSQITKKQFNFLKYLEIRELRVIADTIVLRYIKYKIGANIKEIPEFVNGHMNFFKMRTMEPSSCHFFYYYEELLWRATLIENFLEVFYASEVLESLPHVALAELINGLLSYLHKMATLSPEIVAEVGGKVLKLGEEVYLGKANYSEITDVDLVATGMSYILSHKKDFISKGIQLIQRYKKSNLFKQNEINFLNIYLIRFLLADGKFSSHISVYNEILKLQLNRCNYFLINELFNEIKMEMDRISNASKVLLFGVASLICDFFENRVELSNLIRQFFQLLKSEKEESHNETKSLFDKQFSPQAHIFKLKKSSSLFTAKVLINEQIILSEAKLFVKVKLTLHEDLRKRLINPDSKLQLSFNHNNMVVEVPMVLAGGEGDIVEREFVIEPLMYLRKDSVLRIESVQLVMENKRVVWVIERNQIVFERFDSTLLFCKIEEPEIIIEAVNKIYYLNEAACFGITIKGVEGCKVTSKVLVFEQNEGNTEFFTNIKEKKDLTNSKIPLELVVQGQGQEKNMVWIKCNKLGSKTLKLHFNNTVQKTMKVGWRQKPLSLKSNYNTIKQINFSVSNLFIITKIFRQALTGSLFDNNIPIGKKTLLSFYIKTNENVYIKELQLHPNPRTIIYHKNVRMGNLYLAPGENLKVNLMFQLDQSCQGEIQLFLTTLIIKWTRVGNETSIENGFLDEQIKINAINEKIAISFEQPHEIVKRKKAFLSVKLQNLTNNSLAVKAVMESTDSLARIGEKSKLQLLEPKEKAVLDFDVLAIHSGIFDFPPVKVFVNEEEVKVSTANFLVYCN